MRFKWVEQKFNELKELKNFLQGQADYTEIAELMPADVICRQTCAVFHILNEKPILKGGNDHRFPPFKT